MSRGRSNDLRARAMPWLIETGARFTRPLTIGVRGVILDDDDRVFLVRHGYIPGWHFPGGGVETGETTRAALAREVEEEARIAIRGEPRPHGVFHHRKRDHVVVYVVRDFTVLGDRAPDWEIAEGAFFPVAALPEETTSATRSRLREVLEGVPPAETW